ncbi:MAG: DUF1127 domain-containing protein [Pseudomonadota bacterium]
MNNSNTHAPLGLLFSTTAALVSPAHEAIARTSLYEAIPPLTIRSTVGSALRQVAALLRVWQRRIEQRRQLGLLNDRMLTDIGVEPLEVAQEVEKPFWQA